MAIVTVIGATTWGNTIGKLLVKKGIPVNIWARTEARARELNEEQENLAANNDLIKYLSFTNDIDAALKSSEFVIMGIPAQSLRQTARTINDHITSNMVLVSLSKGLEAETGKRMSEIIPEEITSTSSEKICILSGPNLSQEIKQGLPATTILASRNDDIAQRARDLFHSPNFAVFTSNDVVGTELCGALKNVIALGAGMVDGLQLGENAKATLITMGWNEVTSLGISLGAQLSTFYGLAGLGDLITTCAGNLSRNHYVGFEVATGLPLEEVKTSMINIAEGIDTTLAVNRLANKLGQKMPIINIIYKVLFGELPPSEISESFKQGLNPQANI